MNPILWESLPSCYAHGTYYVCMENWLPVPDYEGLYEVSDHGRVRALERTVERRSCGPRTYPERILSHDINSDGYHRVTLHKRGKRWRIGVHQLVLLAFEGPSNGLQSRHLDDNPHNNVRSNLAWGTRSENEQDKVRNGNNPQLRRTECPQGHKYTPENTQHTSQGRKCRECHRARSRENYARKRANATC